MVRKHTEEGMTDKELIGVLLNDISELGRELDKLQRQGQLPPILVQFKGVHWPAYREVLNRQGGNNPSI